MRSVTPTPLTAPRERLCARGARGAAALAVAVCVSHCSLGDFDSLSVGLKTTDVVNNDDLPGAAGSASESDAGSGSQSQGGASGNDAGEPSGGAGGSETPDASSPVDPPDAGPQPLILDPGFEGGVMNWAPVGNCSLTFAADNPHSGSSSLLTSGRVLNWEGPGYDLLGRLEPGKTYAARVWVRSIENPLTVTLHHKRRCVGDTGEPDYFAFTSKRIYSSWTEVIGTFTTPTCDLIDSMLYVDNPPAGEDFYIDDVSLVLTSP